MNRTEQKLHIVHKLIDKEVRRMPKLSGNLLKCANQKTWVEERFMNVKAILDQYHMSQASNSTMELFCNGELYEIFKNTKIIQGIRVETIDDTLKDFNLDSHLKVYNLRNCSKSFDFFTIRLNQLKYNLEKYQAVCTCFIDENMYGFAYPECVSHEFYETRWALQINDGLSAEQSRAMAGKLLT